MSDYQELISGIMSDWEPTGYVAMRNDVFMHPKRFRRSWVAEAHSTGVTENLFLHEARQFRDLAELTASLRSVTFDGSKVQYVVYPIYGTGSIPSWKRLCPNCRGTCPDELLPRKLLEDAAVEDGRTRLEERLSGMDLQPGDLVLCVNSNFVCIDDTARIFVGYNTGWVLDLEDDQTCTGVRWGRVNRKQLDIHLQQARELDQDERNQ